MLRTNRNSVSENIQRTVATTHVPSWWNRNSVSNGLMTVNGKSGVGICHDRRSNTKFAMSIRNKFQAMLNFHLVSGTQMDMYRYRRQRTHHLMIIVCVTALLALEVDQISITGIGVSATHHIDPFINVHLVAFNDFVRWIPTIV